MAEFDETKFKELIVYIARKLEPEAALGHVKLMKLLMLCDFTAFARLGKPMTGATYEKWEYGHFPREWIIAEKDLDATGAIEQETVDYYGKRLNHIAAERDPDLSRFSEDELAIIETTLRRFGYETASYLSQMSHREAGWQLSDYREAIPYQTALIGMERPPESVFDEFRDIYGLVA